LDLLFDTHSFIWWADEPTKLSRAALVTLEDENNRLFVSDVSIWEMQIKVQLGKIKLKLPFHHKDPFDRLLIAQSIIEDFTIITADSEFSVYPVKLLW